VASVRHELSWLEKLFASMESTLKNNELDQTQVRRICNSVEACSDIITKLEKRLDKAKKEGAPNTLLGKVGDQGRRVLYPFQKGTIVRLLELIENCKEQIHSVVSLLNL
jgi:hypothetical protein